MRRQKHHHFGNPFFAASIELTLAGWESLNWTVETFQLDMQPGSCVLPHGAGFPVSSGQSEVENFLLNIHRDPSWLQFFFFCEDLLTQPWPMWPSPGLQWDRQVQMDEGEQSRGYGSLESGNICSGCVFWLELL